MVQLLLCRYYKSQYRAGFFPQAGSLAWTQHLGSPPPPACSTPYLLPTRDQRFTMKNRYILDEKTLFSELSVV